MNEKSQATGLPTYDPTLTPQPRPISNGDKLRSTLFRVLAVLCLGSIVAQQYFKLSEPAYDATQSYKHHCQQSPAIFPKYGNVTHFYKGNVKDRIIEWHTGAVKIPSQNYDDMGEVGKDPRWEVFADFHEYLETSFPLVYKTFTVEKILTYGLVFEWQGSDSSKQPLMLTGHQDVVPINPATVPNWKYPPFSGHYDGEWIYGRGGSDDKSGLIGIMAALELLIESGFQPSRSLVLAFGFDEETGGNRAAKALGEHIGAKYGPDSMFMLVDEGNGLTKKHGQVFAGPAVGEKGRFDARIAIKTPGGHSSVPPAHTGIGILSQAIIELENHQVSPKLSRQNPVFGTYQCFAETGQLDKEWTHTIKRAAKSNRALKQLTSMIAKLDPVNKAMVTTTRAADLIEGGVKVNALPELSTAVVDHRINADSSIAELQEQMIKVLTPLAKKLDLSFEAFGKNVFDSASAKGHIEMTEAFESGLEPAPISPHDISSPAWNLLSGSVKATWGTRKGAGKDTDIKMMPGLAIGNTDTRRYWELTRNIHRFGYLLDTEQEGIHTINERVKADAIVEIVRFFEHLILNVDEASA